MRNTLSFTLTFAVAIGLVTASAETAMLGAAKDNAIYSESPSNSNGAGDYIFAGTRTSGAPRRGLIAFDLSSIAAGSIINSVTLTLEMTRTIAGSESVGLHRLTSDWGEGSSDAGGEEGGGTGATLGDATWSNSFFGGPGAVAWTTPGGDFDAAASAIQSVGGNGSYGWSGGGLVSDVQDWVDGSLANYGWILIGNEGAGTTAKQFASRENSTVAIRPSLQIDYTPVPEPSVSFFAALSAGMGLLGHRSRGRGAAC